jgi:hypothetical protein
MKITGTSGISNPGLAQGARRPSDPGFALPSAGETQAATGASRAVGVSALGSVDALLALQQVDESLERKRKAVRRGGRLLDLLDRLKLALLGGELGEGELKALATAVQEQRGATGDPTLESVLDQIETRAAVELAKRGVG